MKRPEMKREIAILYSLEGPGIVYGTCTPDMSESIAGFGRFHYDCPDFTLFIDPRYDVKEVISYIESLGGNR